MNADFDLRHLRHFVFLAEELNFTRAAERANLSQTAFSRSIQAMEDQIGVRIFDRGTRFVRLTSSGQTLLGRARSILAQAAEFAREVEGLSQATRGTLVFGAGLMAIDGALAGLLPQLRAQAPHLRIDVAVGNWRVLQQQLENERIEFFVGYPGALSEDSDYTTVPLAREPSSIYCRSRHPLVVGPTSPSPYQLRDYPWANVATADNLNTRRRTLLGFPPGATMPFMLNCDSQALLLETVVSTDTLLFSWSSWLRRHVEAALVVDLGGRLVPRLPSTLLRVDCAVVYRADRTLLPAAQRLIGMIVDKGRGKVSGKF